jgi:uncharacterized protein (TIGR00266 family)
MNIEILSGPGNAAAKVVLEPKEVLTSEGGAMIAMSDDMQITTTTMKKNSGNVLGAVKRMLAGESFFLNHFTSVRGGEVYLATTLPGDMKVFDLQNENLILQGGSFVSCSEGVNVDMTFQGFKNLFSREGLFWLNLNGKGKVIFNSFGAIYPIEVDGEYIVDTGHIVAFNESLNFTLSKSGKSWINSLLGGEGLVCKFRGKGTVWCQSHNVSSFGGLLGPKLKPR